MTKEIVYSAFLGKFL